MNITLQSDAMRELMRRLAEADADGASILGGDAAEPEPAAPEAGSIDQAQDDTDIEDIMTEPKQPKQGTISVETLANDLGMDNTALFKQAFNQLRAGSEPSDPDQIRELAAAFTKLMSTDTSTAQRVVNRLRTIYRKPAPGTPSA